MIALAIAWYAYKVDEAVKLKYFVVSLKHQVEKRAFMQEQLERFGIEFEFFDAVNGRELSDEDKALCEFSDSAILTCSGNHRVKIECALSPGEIGCALSHLKIYQQVATWLTDKSKTDTVAVVLEDDTVINNDTILALHSLDLITAPWDVVQFSEHEGIKNLPWRKRYYFDRTHGFYFARVGWHTKRLDAVFNLRRMVGRTACYVIKPQAAHKLVELGFPVRMPSDYLLGHIAYNQLKLFQTYPTDHFISSLVNVSDIGQRPDHKLIRL